MITINPARALGVDDHLGKVGPGYVADIAVIAKGGAASAAEAVLAADQQGVQLVLLGGKPVYGDKALLAPTPAPATPAAEPAAPGAEPAADRPADLALADLPDDVEIVRLPAGGCGGLEKFFALGAKDGSEDQLAAVLPAAATFRTFAGLDATLRQAMVAYRQKVESGAVPGNKDDLATMPGVYACADAAYAERVARFFEVDVKAAQDPVQRAALRESYQLTAPWSPI